MRAIRQVGMILACLATTAGVVSAQEEAAPVNKHVRQGFWFNIGMGYGLLGCEGCDLTGGLSGGLALGGTLSQKVQLGVASNGWSKSEGGSTFTVGTLTAAIRFYPSETGGFFLLGGLGLSTAQSSGDDPTVGVGAVLGMGYDIRIGKNTSLTPFWNGFGVLIDGDVGGVGQIGLGVTIH